MRFSARAIIFHLVVSQLMGCDMANKREIVTVEPVMEPEKRKFGEWAVFIGGFLFDQFFAHNSAISVAEAQARMRGMQFIRGRA